MFTLSQLVDEILLEVVRPDLLVDATRYVNQTVRETHFSPDRKAAMLFKGNFRELQLTATSETGFTWETPNPATFQIMAGVQYPETFDSAGHPVWAREITPGPRTRQLDYYYYRVGDTFAFSGYNGVDSLINLAYYEFPVSLKYYTEATRPASYDSAEGWTYHVDYDVDDDTRLEARNLVTNWMILRWQDVLSEGVRAKIYKRISDAERGRLCFSMYESQRQGLWTSETMQVYQG